MKKGNRKKKGEFDFDASLRHLRKDKAFKKLIAAHTKPEFRRGGVQGAFQSLVESIIYQQLSGKAAATIYGRFKALYNDGKKFPTPREVLKTPVSKMRSAGISSQKATYLLDLARKFEDGTISPRHFHRMTDEEISAHLIQVKGIGQWTADMFLMFCLNRPDVLPVGDLGIRKALQKMCNLKTLPSPEEMRTLARKWEGHRTIACLYLWKSVDGE